MPTVSVIIPTYNRASLLKEAILSVLNQSFKDWELLVVDDRSTDKTEEVVNSFSKKNTKIKYLRNEFKKGPSGARNYGICHATGDFIAFLDSDDLWKPWHLDRGIYFLKRNPNIDWFYADLEKVKDRKIICKSVKKDQWKGRKKFLTEELEKNFFVFKDNDFLAKALKYEIYAGLQTSIVRKEVFSSVKFDEDIRIGEDKLIVYEAIIKGFKFAYLLEIHASYRIHGGHLSNILKEDNFDIQINKILEYSKLYKKLLMKIPAKAKSEKKIVEKKLAYLFFWDIGYALLWQHKHFKASFNYFKRGLNYYPYDWRLWKTYFLCKIRYYINSLKERR